MFTLRIFPENRIYILKKQRTYILHHRLLFNLSATTKIYFFCRIIFFEHRLLNLKHRYKLFFIANL
jgi:hypothetical protein